MQVIYSLLKNKKSLTAKEIGHTLHIFPNAVYRSIKYLIRYGFVAREGTYPVRFVAQEPKEAIELFTNEIHEDLAGLFVSDDRETHQHFNISFVTTRKDLLDKTNADLRKAEKEADIIVSGLEVPAETMLANKQAIDRGVRLRVIVQNLDEVKKEMLGNWRKNGIEIKYFSLMKARLFIFDAKTVYITSYNPKEKEEANGVRFNYPPVARMMHEFFKQKWKRAKSI
ncbi:hypothetical protein HY407_00860 [Candidatus Gottesmanbacteria bacterium]|nr:hypothetical protein [Candidatus Gottesmanbacteria bacterium]